jgi:hypothetical protein
MGDEDTYHQATTDAGGNDTLHEYVDGVLQEDHLVDAWILYTIPAADPHVIGQVWNSAGVMKISAG